jgi:hypothetical protein
MLSRPVMLSHPAPCAGPLLRDATGGRYEVRLTLFAQPRRSLTLLNTRYRECPLPTGRGANTLICEKLHC